MGGQNFTNEQQRVADIRIQSSAYGNTVPWLLVGRGRVAGNLLYYGAFKAIKHTDTQSAGGKGGGGKQTTVSYTYQAAVIIGLARGPLVGGGAMWRGKSQFPSLSAGGLSLQLGNLGQAVWSWLTTNDPSKALGYSGMAYAYAPAYDLDDSAALPNHNFELDAGGLGTVPGVSGTVVDGDPRVAVERLLTDTRSGGGWPSARLLGLDRYQAYCRAAGLWLSPVLSEQRPCIDWLKQLLLLTNTKAAYTGSELELVPLGDTDLSAHGATFTAEVTPDFDLTHDHFHPDKGDPPVRVRRHYGLGAEAETASSDDVGYNVVTLKIESRAAGYAEQPISRDDLASIEMFGRREKDAIAAPEIKDAAIGAQVAQQLLQDELAKRNRYEFNLSWRFCLLKPLRLVTLTEPSLGFDRLPVRILEVEELDDRRISVVAEDAPIGIATAPRFGAQAGAGYSPDYNVSPGSALDPLVFELPGALTTTGLELAVATASSNPMWGGCQVWVSYDGTNYRQIAELRADSRYGITQLDSGSSMALFTNAGQQLLSGTAADAANLATLIYVAPAGAIAGEFMAYQTATLTAANAYTLSGLVRGAYGTPQVEHGGGTPWVRVDDAIARSGPLDPALIGKTVYIKLTSFNVFGGGQQSLADVAATSYAITGAHYVFGQASSTLGIKLNTAVFADGATNYNEAYVHGRDASGNPVDAPGSILVNGVPTPVPNGPIYSNLGPVAGYIMWAKSGPWFSVLGTSTRPLVLARCVAGQWQYDDNNAGSWTDFAPTPGAHYIIGTLESGAPDTGNPGSAPGLVAASLWAAAETPSAIVATASAAHAAATAAQSTANTAASNASSALSTLATMRSNGYLDAAEKPAIIKQWQAIDGERSGIYNQGTTYALTSLRDSYWAAYLALSSYLSSLSPSWADTTTDTPITPAVDQSTWSAYYSARQALLSAIADETAKRANWSQVANRPSDDSIRNNLIDVSWWRQDATLAWATNAEYNRLVNTSPSGGADLSVSGPRGGNDCVWYCQESTGDGSQGGGWEAPNTLTLDPSKTYRFVVPVRVMDATAGYAYWGVQQSTVCDINTTSQHGNPYFVVLPHTSMQTDRWYLLVGYVYPFGSTGHSHGDAGAYDCKTGALVYAGNNWNQHSTGAAGHRAYQYYTSPGERQLFGRPMVNVVDGTEPSLREYFEPGALLNSALVPSISAAQAAADAAQTTANTASSNASSALSTLATMRSNGYLDAAEKPALIKAWQAIADESTGIYNAGTNYGLTSLRDAYLTARDNLSAYLVSLSPSWSDTTADTPITPATDNAKWSDYYASRQALLNAIAAKAKQLADDAQTSANAAASAASTAQTTANTAATNASSALSTLATMRSNGYIDAAEKPALIKAWQAIYDENAGIDARAASFGITAERSTWAAAFSALSTYLGGLSPSWNDTTTDTPITPATDNAKWSDYYTARQALLNKFAEVSATQANWSGVAGRPFDFDQDTTPGGTITEGSSWRVPSTGRTYRYLSGSWQPYVGSGSVGTGELADQAATDVTVVTFSAITVSNIA